MNYRLGSFVIYPNILRRLRILKCVKHGKDGRSIAYAESNNSINAVIEKERNSYPNWKPRGDKAYSELSDWNPH